MSTDASLAVLLGRDVTKRGSLPDDFTITVPDRHFTRWNRNQGRGYTKDDDIHAKIAEIKAAAHANGYDVTEDIDVHHTLNHYFRFVRRKPAPPPAIADRPAASGVVIDAETKIVRASIPSLPSPKL